MVAITVSLLVASWAQLWSGPSTAEAAGAPDTRNSSESALYDRCLKQARSAPQGAYDHALAWFDTGGGLPARHCAAVALIGLKAYAEAASRLETLATDVADDRQDLRVGLLTQAAQAWLLSGRAARAESLQSLAIAALPDDPQLRVDRAVTRLSLDRYWAAIEDLDTALDRGSPNPEIYLYRAVAYRNLEVLDLAGDDIDRALALDPDHPEAWLERGILERQAGNTAAARDAWTTVLRLVPSGRAAETARAQLEALELGR